MDKKHGLAENPKMIGEDLSKCLLQEEKTTTNSDVFQ